MQKEWQQAFPGLVSYQRFVEWMPSALLPLCAYLRSYFGNCTGISFMDSTSLKVCHNRRIKQHRVFKDLVARGKTRLIGSLASNYMWWSMTKLTTICCLRLNPNSRWFRIAIAKAIAQAHQGSIQVRSALGKGSTFTVRLPKVMDRIPTNSDRQ